MTVKVVPERAGLSSTHTRDVFYGYDLRNLQLYARFDSASGQGVTNTYDGFGRLASSSTNMGGTGRTLTYQYRQDGVRTRITHPDGTYFLTNPDALGRPYSISDPAGWRILFSYKPHGALYGMSLASTASILREYDGVQRLYSLGHYFPAPHAGSNVVWSFSRNPASQLASVARNNDAYAWQGHYQVTRPYTTNGLNQYIAAGGAAFAYDLNGNLVSDSGRALGYDVENRLVTAAPNVVLTYDPLGRLFSVTSPTTATRFLYDGDALVAEYNAAGTLLRRYAHGEAADVPLLAYEGATLANLRYLHADHQGSIVAHSSAAGAVTAINRYDEYGIPAATNVGRFQYTGQIWIPELGMYHYKARIYSPTLGRFLQTDPVGYDDQFNLYAYVGNDPVNRIDPDGRRTICIDGLCTITADTHDPSRSSDTVRGTDALDQQVVSDRAQYQPTGGREVLGFSFGREAGSTSTRVSQNVQTRSAGRDPRVPGLGQPTRDEARAPIPSGATSAIHGHRVGAADGMIDAEDTLLGDSQPVTVGLPGYVVHGDRVGVREMVGGQLQHRMVRGQFEGREAEAIQRNLNRQQSIIQRRRRDDKD